MLYLHNMQYHAVGDYKTGFNMFTALHFHVYTQGVILSRLPRQFWNLERKWNKAGVWTNHAIWDSNSSNTSWESCQTKIWGNFRVSISNEKIVVFNENLGVSKEKIVVSNENLGVWNEKIVVSNENLWASNETSVGFQFFQ